MSPELNLSRLTASETERQYMKINAKEGNQAYWDLYLFFRLKLQPLS